uniref:Uncharacterized protein n=1 Tax=Providencia alcalifaciens TaxID=126385 RepID=H7C8H3_9GAMM|nr:hypothetical protein [Providencia alcalifaciens]
MSLYFQTLFITYFILSSTPQKRSRSTVGMPFIVMLEGCRKTLYCR